MANFDHRANLEAIFASFATKGVSAERLTQLRALADSDPVLVQNLSEGFLAQDEFNRRQNDLSAQRTTLENNQRQWQEHLRTVAAQVNATDAEKMRFSAENAAMRTAIRSIQANYQIPDAELNQMFPGILAQPTVLAAPSFTSAPTYQSTNPQNGNGYRPIQPAALTQEDLGRSQMALLDDFTTIEDIKHRHFLLTGEHLNPKPIIEFMKQQATIGKPFTDEGNVSATERAWRVMHQIDQKETEFAARTKAAEREAIKREVQEELAAQSHLPTDPALRFDAAPQMSHIFKTIDPNDPNKERTGRQGRTQLASAALMERIQRRRQGLPLDDNTGSGAPAA